MYYVDDKLESLERERNKTPEQICRRDGNMYSICQENMQLGVACQIKLFMLDQIYSK
jgi:hypothetical protein